MSLEEVDVGVPVLTSQCTPTWSKAVAFSVVVTSSYVGMLYLPFNRGDRNQPRAIASRILSSIVLAFLCSIYTRTSFTRQEYGTPDVSTTLLDYTGAALVTAALTLLLYTGHFLARLDGRIATPRISSSLRTKQQRWLFLRNYILAPLVEEIVFRQQALLMWRCFPMWMRVIGPASLFGVAHLHHVSTVGLPVALLQFNYTFVFGMYAAVLLMHSGTIVAPVTAHVLCNVLELPDFNAIARHKRSRLIMAMYAVALALFSCLLYRSRDIFEMVK